MSPHDDLPHPAPGETAEEYRRRATASLGVPVDRGPRTPPPTMIDPYKTPVSLPLARAIGLAITLAGGAWYAGTKIQAQTYEIAAIKSQLADLPKRSDLESLRRDVTDGTARRLENAMVRCPRVAVRGESWIDCKLIVQ